MEKIKKLRTRRGLIIDTGSIVAIGIALGGWAVQIWKIRTDRKNNKKNKFKEKVEDYIDKFAELQAFYRFYAWTEGSIRRDDEGNFIKNEEGDYIIDEKGLEPKGRFDKELKKMNDADIKSAITQQIIKIKLNSSAILDRLELIAPDGNWKEVHNNMFRSSIKSIENILNKEYDTKIDKFQKLIEKLDDAKEARRDFRKEAIELIEKKM